MKFNRTSTRNTGDGEVVRHIILDNVRLRGRFVKDTQGRILALHARIRHDDVSSQVVSYAVLYVCVKAVSVSVRG